MNKKFTIFILFIFILLDLTKISAQAILCPSVNAQVGTGPTTTICQGKCATLTASVVSVNATNTYSVQSLPYQSFPYVGGAVALSGIDDIWSAVVPIGFNFCYFGNTYNQCVIGSNGEVTFQLANAGAYDGWSISTPLPNIIDMPGNTICGAFRDIDPTFGGTINYYVTGTAPCRALVVYWKNIPLFSCGTPNTFAQIVLYETTNFIDVNMQNSSTCATWNSGRAIVGIENLAGTVGYAAPGRNSPTVWSTTNESWRFVPTGPASYTVTWTGPNGIVGTGLSVVVCPTVTSNYTATAVMGCTNGATVTGGVQVAVINSTATASNTGPYCPGSTIQLNGSAATSYTWTGPGGFTSNLQNPTIANATATMAGTYTLITTVGTCTAIATTTVIINPLPLTLTPTTPSFCPGGSVVLTAGGATTYSWSPGTGLSSTTGAIVTASPLVTTIYTVVGTVGTCASQLTATVTVFPKPTGILTSTNATCGQSNGVIVISNTSGFGQTITSYTFDGGAMGTQTVTGVSAGTHTVVMTNNFGCTTAFTVNILNNPGITNLQTTTVSATCGNSNGSFSLGVVTGGTPTYSYSFNGGALSGTTLYNNLAAGTYTIGVTDASGCTFTKTVVISNIPGPTAITYTTGLTACVGSTGSFSVTGVTGGTPAYQFTVNGVATGSVTNSLGAGTQTVIVKDANGCLYSTTFNINTVLGPNSTTVVTLPASCGNNNGSATVTAVSGGLPGYQYSLNGGPFTGTNIFIGLAAGTKTLVIKDANNCTYTANFNIGNTGSPNSVIGQIINVSCFGGANGGFSVTTVGGTPGYNYTVTPGNITSGTGIFGGLTAGNYNVNVQDAAGCITNVSVSIGQPTQLSLTLTPFPTSCNAGANGSITANGSGGTGPYTYNINGGGFQAGTTFTALSAGVYNITLKDNNGCTLTKSVSVSQPPAISLAINVQNANCTASNGNATVTASGGTPAYTYGWTGGGGSSNVTNPLAAGNYTVTVTDANGCIKTAVAVINVIPGGTAVITASTNVTCFGFNNGVLNAAAAGNMTGPFTYNWSNGPTIQTNSGLSPGPYTCTITDVYGCKATVTGNITQPGAIDFLINTTSVTCYQGTNGTASYFPLGGGTPPFTYLWAAGGQTTSTASNLPAGQYSLTVTDANGCNLTKTVQVVQPTSVTLTSTVTTANCNQSNGSATVSASGGTPAYSYTWSTSQTGAVLSNAAAGTYTVQVKDGNGCIYVLAATVPNAQGPSLAITSQTNISCNGGNNGAALATASGGVPGYTYLWSNGQNTGTSTNLIAGVYTATVTDAMGCKASVSVTITQPSPLTVSVTGSNPKCFGGASGTANAGVLGGTPGYNYTWTPTGGNASTAINLTAGNYIVTVMDANGCIKTATTSLVNPPVMLASITSTNVSCNGACNGVAVATTTNSGGGVTYVWIGGSNTLFTQTVTSLCNGSYTMTATDQNGCVASSIVNITQPTLLTASITAAQNVSCATYTNGFATVTPAGGTPGYTYNWTSGSSVATATGLGAGTYTATITDSKGCTASDVIIITQPTPLTAAITSSNVTCNGLNNGIGNVNYNGGTGPYTFLWLPTLANSFNVTNLPPGTHTVQIKDVNGCITTLTTTVTQPAPLIAVLTSTNSNCNQANGAACVAVSGGTGTISYLWTSNPTFTNSCIQNVTAGAYTITVTDANGCNTSAIATINDIAGPNVSITATTAVSCFGGSNGSANTSITGGTGTISIIWSYLAQTTSSVNNLPAGIHAVTVKDQAGCISSATLQMTQPPQLTSAIINVNNITCNGFNNGSATMILNGGTPNYSYLWTPSAQSSSMAVSLAAGTHSCTITDANGCKSSQQVTISQPSPLLINSFTITHVLCNGGNNGQISTIISGGTPIYVLAWTPIQPPNAVITNLAAGMYSLLVTDANGCTTSGNYIVNQPSALLTASSATPATCGNANGAATVTVNGGTPNYTYLWSNSQTTSTSNSLTPGTWTCVITDNNGCVTSQTAVVANAPGPNITGMNFTKPLCYGQLNGTMSFSFTSGTAPYVYQWSNSATTQTVNGVGAGVYTATVTDNYGCISIGVVNVTQPNILVLNVNPDSTICYGNTATIYAQGGGGTPNYTYSWTPSTLIGAGPHSVNPTTTSSYMVTMSDANGCSTSAKTIIIKVRPQLIAQGFAITKCDKDQTTLTPNITSAGNGGPYSYNWSNGAGTSAINVTADYANNPNTYSVIISDGCTSPNATANFTVNVNPLPIGSFTADITKGCAPLSVNFMANSNGTNDQYTWDFGNAGGIGGGNITVTGSGNPMHVLYGDSGFYSVGIKIMNQFGCTSSYSVHNYIQVYSNPRAEFSASPWLSTILEPNIKFINQSYGASTYFWDFGDYNSIYNTSTAVNPSHEFTYAGVYSVYLVAINSHGCTDTVMHSVEILPDYAIYIPNTFTPDDNGKNDIFQPKGVGINPDQYKMYIFDRWGEVIFTSNNFYTGWDGKVKGTGTKAEQGVYIYKIYAEDLEGNQHNYVGHVNLLSKVHPN